MKSKKIITLILCSLMLTQVFAGCKSKQTDTPTTDTSVNTETGSLYPISKGDVTLKIWMSIPPAATKYIKTYAENEAFKKASEETGVKLEFVHPPTGQETEQFNLMVASDELTDIIVNQRYKGGDIQGVQDGIFEDLTELIPKYAPDYYALMKEDPEFKREATTAEGKIYTFYSYKNVPASVEGEWYRIQFRQDWLEEFKMDVPKTFDQYEAYFKKVHETKPDVAPFVLAKSGVEKQLLGAFDLSSDYFLKYGKITWYGVEPAYKDYLTLLNKWYKAGYISKDFASADPSKLFEAGKAASFFGASINLFQRSKELGIKVTSGPYPRLKENQTIHNGFVLFPKNSSWGTNISAKSKYKNEAVKFMNYGYSKEGYKTYAYGPKDIAWTAGPDGQPKYTDYVLNHPKYSITDVDNIIRLHDGFNKLRDGDRYSIPMNIKTPDTLNYRLKWADDPNVDASYILPPFTLTPDENTKRADIMNDIQSYVAEMTLKFIIGAEPLSNFDKYINTIKSMGIDKALSITQKAYDTHMKK